MDSATNNNIINYNNYSKERLVDDKRKCYIIINNLIRIFKQMFTIYVILTINKKGVKCTIP